jgi:hypothetical protein
MRVPVSESGFRRGRKGSDHLLGDSLAVDGEIETTDVTSILGPGERSREAASDAASSITPLII